MKKKILAMVLMATMLIGASMSVSAAATTVSGSDADKTVTSGNAAGDSIRMLASVSAADIEVEIKVGSTVVANPYGLTVGSVSDTLVGAIITFENKSDTPIEVGLKGQIDLPTYNTEPTAQRVSVGSSKSEVMSATTKQVFVQAEIVASESISDKKIAAENVKYFVIKNSAGEKKKVAPLVYEKTAVAIASNPVLDKAGVSGNDATTNCKMAVVLSGATSISPDYAWGDSDKFTVVTFYDLKLSNKPSLFVDPTK